MGARKSSVNRSAARQVEQRYRPTAAHEDDCPVPAGGGAGPRQPAVALGLARVYFELSMLDEAADQFQKIEVRAPDLPAIHAYLGAVFERRGQVPEAFEEYRRALRSTASFEWPHRCGACGTTSVRWVDRCPSCRRWNSLRP